MDFKTGKKPAQYDAKQIHLLDITPTIKPMTAPVGFSPFKLVKSAWGMLGNDRVGDCVFAGSAHETMVLTAIGGYQAAFNDSVVLSDYSYLTGYNPANPYSDQGTDMRQAMSYRRHTGVADSRGVRHKIGAYLALEPGNWTQLLQALYAFQVVGVGIEFPGSAMDQFNAKKPWTVVAGASNEGGHYIPVVGHSTTNYVELITWGRVTKMSKAFYQKYNDESYVFVSTEDLVGGKSPQGYDLNALTQIMAAL